VLFRSAPPPGDDDDRPRKKRPRDDDDDDAPRKRRDDDDPGAVGTVIPYKNSMALISYYLGVFGLIPCVIGLGVLGIVPIVLGVLGLMKARSDPHAHGTAHAMIGIGLGAVEMLTGCGVIGFFGYQIATSKR